MASDDVLPRLPPETLEWFCGDELRARVFIDKYALKDKDGKLLETTPEQMWLRVASEIASVEKTPELQKEWTDRFEWLLQDFRMVPGGRILFGAGADKQGRRVTLNNCYVIPIADDSLESIFEWTKEAARTYSLGGGVGVDISVLRPKGAHVNNAARYSSGAVSFMNIFSETTGTIGQEGRRGALMITMDVHHPDILDFIKVKRNLQTVRYANISVKITDEFMKAVEDNAKFTLRYKSEKAGTFTREVEARKLWNELVSSARDWAEPGLIFWDKMKAESTSEYNGMNILTTNPCSEIPLEGYGACNLGNLNLSTFVLFPFEKEARFDFRTFARALSFTTRFLDDVVDYNLHKHPLKGQTEEAKKSRRIGVGFTGLADMLLKLRIKYDSDEALQLVDEVFMFAMEKVYLTSTELAKEKGTFPGFDVKQHWNSPFIQRLPHDIKDNIELYGLRNVALLTIPPVGSGSALAATSSGIEPVFAFSYTRKSESLSKSTFKVYHPLVQEYLNKFEGGVDSRKEGILLPDYFVESHNIQPEFRVRMQSTIQKYIDHSISSTVNLPEDVTVEQVSKIYFDAWKAGCKGITVYREGSREGVLLTEKKTQEFAKKEREFVRPMEMLGKTFVIQMVENGKVYVTINNSSGGKPVEIFLNVGKSGTEEKAYSEAIGRLASLYLQSGGDPMKVVHSLKGIKGKSVTFISGGKVFSVPDAVAFLLEGVIRGRPPQSSLATSLSLDPDSHELNDKEDDPPSSAQMSTLDNTALVGKFDGMLTCPRCGNDTMVSENGCLTCKTCGYSKCE